MTTQKLGKFMKSGYKIHWTDFALEELQEAVNYLEQNFSEKEIQNLARKIESVTELISQNPNIFQKSEIKNVHQVIILKYNSMYYRIVGNEIQILSFFSNRQGLERRKI